MSAEEPSLTGPPRPALCLRLGVTGHRMLPPEHQDRIEAQLADLLARVEEHVAYIDRASAGWFANEPPVHRLVSPLASGADTLAAQAALARSWSLQVVTPFGLDAYADDFAPEDGRSLTALLGHAETVLQLGGSRADEEDEAAAYLAAGKSVLEQSDLLVAMWDGEAARGIGGTAMIVEMALTRGVPVVWIRTNEAAPPCLLGPDFRPASDLDALPDVLSAALSPPSEAPPPLFEERERRRNHGWLFGLFEAVIGSRKLAGLGATLPPYAARTESEWRAYLGGTEDLGGDRLRRRIEDLLMRRFAWADSLGVYYGGLYRSSYVANFLLSALAVALAVAEIVVGFGKEVFIALETLVILVIAAITVRGRKAGWHDKWIDYRQLAEQLRQARFLYLTGAPLGAVGARSDYGAAPAGSWVTWYVEATMRELGLPHARADEAYVASVRRLFEETELEPQIAYYRANAHRMHHTEHALHKIGDALFAATLLTCLVFLGAFVLYEWAGLKEAKGFKTAIKPWVTVLTALLPAIGAALLGIRVQGEFGSTAERSEAAAARLSQIADDLATRREPLTFGALRRVVEASAETMMAEVVDWRFVFRGKPLALPA